jgi:glucose-6-phosphate isomerase, archaeal
MAPAPLIPPASLLVDPRTGVMGAATRHYQKRLADLAGLYADAPSFEALRRERGDEVVYEVYEFRASEAPGDLVVGTSVMKPGRVGAEYFLTRGHRHRLADRSEVYYCQAGSGVMLMEAPGGETRAVPLTRQSVVYVPPHWIHRSVNTGPDTLVTVFCYAADAGQDYEVIERAGGMRMRVVADGAGWKLVENPGWRAVA